MEHLNLFNNETAYNTAKDNLETPGVSYAEGENKVFYDPIPPAESTPVDLGLSVKWAAGNLGAMKPEDYGLYFAWGETEGYTNDINDGRVFNWTPYKWCNGSSTSFTKYNDHSSYGIVDNKIVLEPEDDAAVQNLGGKWRMPTKAEYDELLTKTTSTWDTVNGIKGKRYTASNGNSIFIPASGFRSSQNYNVGASGNYWSSSYREKNPLCAWCLFFSTYNSPYTRGDDRCLAYSIRPVLAV